jgi:hypothetical protein
MASFDQLVKEKIRLFEEVPKRLETAAIKTQAEAWKKIRPLLDEMDVDASGNITNRGQHCKDWTDSR